MFCPFYLPLSVFDSLATFILQSPQTENGSARSPQRFTVALDQPFTSPEVLLAPHSDSFLRYKVSGNGKSIANTQLVQDRAYFEVTVTQLGTVSVGVSVSSKDALLQQVGQDALSCGETFNRDSGLRTGSVIGITVDQSDSAGELKFYIDNEFYGERTVRTKGPFCPAVGVGAGAEVEVSFDSRVLQFTPPANFTPIIFSQNFMF